MTLNLKSQDHTRLWRVSLYILMAINSTAILAHDVSLEKETSIYSAMSMGTGWALTQRHIVTNFHVINNMRNLRIVTAHQVEIPVKVVVSDEDNDLVILLIQDESIQVTPLPLAQTQPRLGSQVFTIGYPHPNLMGTSPKLTRGLINATNGLADDPRSFQVSVPVQSGNSGGPLLNMHGEVVGVITSKLNSQKMFDRTGDIPQNVNYAIKIQQLNKLIHKLETDELILLGDAKKTQTLETLAANIINSVIIVAGDGEKQKTHDFHSRTELIKQIPSPDHDKKRVLVYSYSEPGYYDVDDNIKGSYSVEAYSKNMLKLIHLQLQNHLKGQNKFISKGGDSIKKIFYRLENMQYRESLCKNNNAGNIIASYSEGTQGYTRHFRFITYRLIDCRSQKMFKKEYRLYRDELNDSFGFEVELHTTFKDFLVKTPPYISWNK